MHTITKTIERQVVMTTGINTAPPWFGTAAKGVKGGVVLLKI